MNRLAITLLFVLVSFVNSNAQDYDSVPTYDMSIDTSKWPYFGPIPPYVGVSGGYEGFQTSFWEAGLAINFFYLVVDPNIGGLLGTILSYKRDFSNRIEGIDVDVGIFSPLSFGVGGNYQFTEENSVFGIKPFIGTTIYNLQFIWGYNFFLKKDHGIENLRNSIFKIRVIIPLLKV